MNIFKLLTTYKFKKVFFTNEEEFKCGDVLAIFESRTAIEVIQVIVQYFDDATIQVSYIENFKDDNFKIWNSSTTSKIVPLKDIHRTRII